MTQLSLCLFGAPQIELNGAPVKLTQRKPLALLAYLGVTGTPHTREHLATLLWPEAEPERALAYLRNALWQLNQTPIAAWIEIDRDTVGLRQDTDLCLDVAHFERLRSRSQTHGHQQDDLCPACVAALSEAVDIYRGDFMEGVTLEDSAGFDEWQFFQTEALRQGATEALEKLVRYHEQSSQGEARMAIEFARRWLAFDPQNESAHRALMRLYALTDQRAAALRQYDACIRALKENLGTPPDKSTVDLYRRLRSGELFASPSTVPAPQDAPEQRKTATINLPASANPFVGRQEELAEVRRLLAQPACRLLSLVGPGGIGKTRLALEAARCFAEEAVATFADGIVMVSLASVSTPKAALQEVAAALSLTPARQPEERLPVSGVRIPRPAGATGDTPMLRQMVIDYLHDRSLLLILDNLEHLLGITGPVSGGSPSVPRSEGIAELVERVLQSAPGVRLLVTSRERLNLLPEWVFVLSGMSLPVGNASNLAESGAIRLFIQSAERAMVGFEPTQEELNSIATICRLVEGNPLAMKLAASWVRFLPCEEIADEIRASFDFLSSSLRDVPERHRSLRTIFEHSWTLLPDEEADTFARLAIFPGSFTREAAREVTGSSLVMLSTLMDKSLLQQVTSGDRPASGRYGMHTVLRQYAEAKLKLKPGGFEQIATRHAHYYLTLLARMEPALKGEGQGQALETIHSELTNVRAAWLWATHHLAVAELRQALVPLHLFCVMRGHFQEAVVLLGATVDTFTARTPELGPSLNRDGQALLGLLLVLLELHTRAGASTTLEATGARGLAMLETLEPSEELAIATLVWVSMNRVLDRAETNRRLQETLDFYERRGDIRGRADTLHLMGVLVADRHDDYLEGEAALEHALQLHRQAGDSAGVAEDLTYLGMIADSRGMNELAEQRYEEALVIYRDLGNPTRPLTSLLQLGDLARRSGDAVTAREWLDEALSIARGLGDLRAVASVLNHLWMTAFDAGAYIEAKRIAEEEIALWQRVQSTSGVAGAQQRLADTLLALGEFALARHYLKESLSAVPNNVWGILGLAHIAELEGDLSGAFETYRQAIQLAQDVRGLSIFPVVPATLKGMIGLSRLYARQGDSERAAELLGLVLHHPTLHDTMRTEAEGLLVDFLGCHIHARVDAARLRGETLDLDAVAAEITEGVTPFTPQ